MTRAMAAMLFLGSLLHPVRVTFWVQKTDEYDFVLKDHLGVDADRICGTVSRDGELWDAATFKSGGARAALSSDGMSLVAAKLTVEQVCR